MAYWVRKVGVVIFLTALLVGPAQAQEGYKVYLPMILSAIADNNWRLIKPISSTNYVLNPSAETAGNFAALSGTTVTRVTTYQKYGLYSYRVEVDADNEGISLTLSALTNANHYVTMRVAGTLPASWDWSLNNSNYVKPILIEKIDDTWKLYGLHFQAGQANGQTTLYIRQDGSGVGDFYLDGIQVEPLNVWTTYIDGTQEGCAWNGVEHASTSTRSGQSRAGGQPVDFWSEYGFQVERVSGAGAVSHRLGVDGYAILPGGELNSDKVQPREFHIIGKFIAGSEADLLEKKRALESAFYTVDAQLTRIRFNGGKVQKELAVRYQGGLEGDLAAFYGNIEIVEDDKLAYHQIYTEKASIQVVAPYPYWQEVGESAVLLDTNDSATFNTIAARLKSTGQWSNLGPPNALGTYSIVYALAEDATYLYIGGNFLNFDNIANADYIVRYNKQTGVYSAMGTGANNEVYAIVVMPNGDVIAGGSFSLMGGVANTVNIARWNGSSWNALSSGTNGAVTALALAPSGLLYLGGFFTTAGGGAANRIASWNGSAFAALGSGSADLIRALSVDKYTGILYIGGNFTAIGGVSANRIASWNGSAFAALGSGTNGNVFCLAIDDNSFVYLGGDFTSAGGNPASGVAGWNGTNFFGLSSGVSALGIPHSMAIGNDRIFYLGGDFVSAGGLTLADKAARWNGYSWAHLDIDFPGSPQIEEILPSKYSDSVTKQKYDLFIGFTTTGVGNYAGKILATNDGNAQAFPKIVFERSGGTTAIAETLRNETTGKEILFNYSLLDGERLTIDLVPTQRSVISNLFGSVPSAILANSDFGSWSLHPGSQSITSFVATTGSPTVNAYMLWRESYSGY